MRIYRHVLFVIIYAQCLMISHDHNYNHLNAKLTELKERMRKREKSSERIVILILITVVFRLRNARVSVHSYILYIFGTMAWWI